MSRTTAELVADVQKGMADKVPGGYAACYHDLLAAKYALTELASRAVVAATLREALRQIGLLDYRGHPSAEQEIARSALDAIRWREVTRS